MDTAGGEERELATLGVAVFLVVSLVLGVVSLARHRQRRHALPGGRGRALPATPAVPRAADHGVTTKGGRLVDEPRPATVEAKCPATLKRCHATRREAEAHLAQLKDRPGNYRGHCYQCRACTFWHVGKCLGR